MNRDEKVSVNIFETISRICRDFRKQISAGKSPRIETFLGDILDDGRATLFSNLLEIELRFRQMNGEHPASDEYLQRFPEFKTQIRRAFFEPTMASMEWNSRLNDETRSFGDANSSEIDTATFAIPDANRLGNYELIRELGRGGMGVVYEARHTGTNHRVALKTLPTGGSGQEVNVEKLYRFRREFRRLSEINHPNLVGMQSLEVDGSQWFFTMDLIDGEDFYSFVRPGKQLDPSRLRSCLKQLATGIVALHNEGIIHRDLKPQNILVSETGHVSILDFGLAAEIQQAVDMTQTKSGMFAGTPRYAAPEQLFGERTEASDWYAFGTIIYECLADTPPFNADNPVKLLKIKQKEEAPSLIGLEGVPEDLASLAHGLMLRDPDQRWKAETISETLQVDSDTGFGSRLSSCSHDSAEATLGNELSTVDEEEYILIGRESQLECLEAARQRMLRSGQPMAVWITGLSGEGKSSLARKFLQPFRRSQEMLVLSGRCYDRESVPFKAIDSIIEPLVRYLRSLSKQELHQILPVDIEMLAQLFPLLNRVEAILALTNKQLLSLDSRQIRNRAFDAFAKLLTAIGERTPVALMIDDLQWGDSDSALALFELLYSNAPPALLLLGTYRRDEMDKSSFYRQWTTSLARIGNQDNQQFISLGPLTKDDCVALATARTGMSRESAHDAVAKLFHNTQGNPYLLEQLFESFEAGATEWQPLPLNQIIHRRLTQLPEDAETVLNHLAIAGKAIHVEELDMVAEIQNGVHSLLAPMRNERLLRLVGGTESQLVDTWHDKIRETTLEQLAPSTRRAMHLRFAEAIESSAGLNLDTVESWLDSSFTENRIPDFPTSRVYDLAYHFQLAKDRRAPGYQLLAGELAFQNYATEEATEYLERARQILAGNHSQRWKARLWHRLAASSYRSINFDKALEQFETGIQYAREGMERAVFYYGKARLYQNLTRYEEATRHHDLALAEIGQRRPRGPLAYPGTAFNLGKLFCFPESWLLRTRGKTTPAERLEHSIYVDLCAYLFERHIPIIEYPAALMRLGVISHQLDAEEIASGVGLVAGQLSLSGFPGLGRRFAQRASSRLGKTDDAANEGTAHMGIAAALSYSGIFDESDREYKRSIPLLVKSGSHIFHALSLHLWRHLKESVGTASAEADLGRSLVELTQYSGDLRSNCWGKYDVAAGLARQGQTGKSLEWIRESDLTWKECNLNLTTPIYFAQRSFVLLQASQYDLAKQCSDHSWRVAFKNKNLMDVCLRGLAWYLECAAGAEWATNPARINRRLAWHRCHWARLLAGIHVKLRPHMLRSRGRIYIATGKRAKGIRNFNSAARSARKLGMKYDLAKSLLDLAAVQEKGRDENRAEAIQLLVEMESVIPRAESWLLGDQVDERVLAPEFDIDDWIEAHGPLATDPECNSPTSPSAS